MSDDGKPRETLASECLGFLDALKELPRVQMADRLADWMAKQGCDSKEAGYKAAVIDARVKDAQPTGEVKDLCRTFLDSLTMCLTPHSDSNVERMAKMFEMQHQNSYKAGRKEGVEVGLKEQSKSIIKQFRRQGMEVIDKGDGQYVFRKPGGSASVGCGGVVLLAASALLWFWLMGG